MAEYMLEIGEDDYNLEDFFPKAIAEHLQPFIEYRIKLVLKEDTLFRGGESLLVNTSCVIKGKMKSRNGFLRFVVP